MFLLNDVIHVSHYQADRFNLRWWLLVVLFVVWNGLFHWIKFLDFFKDFQFVLRPDFHLRKLETIRQYTWDVLHQHVLVDEVGENLSVIDINASNILLVRGDLVEEPCWHNNDD